MFGIIDGSSKIINADYSFYARLAGFLKDFGIEPEFNVNNPLDYMARIGLSAKNNFFEQRIGQYTRVDIPTTTDGMFDDDF